MNARPEARSGIGSPLHSGVTSSSAAQRNSNGAKRTFTARLSDASADSTTARGRSGRKRAAARAQSAEVPRPKSRRNQLKTRGKTSVAAPLFDDSSSSTLARKWRAAASSCSWSVAGRKTRTPGGLETEPQLSAKLIRQSVDVRAQPKYLVLGMATLEMKLLGGESCALRN